jgi:hypothetical protein
MQRAGAVFVLISLLVLLPCTASAAESMKMIQSGISGYTTARDVAIVDLDGSGERSILLGTSTGLYIIDSDGSLRTFIQTSSPVTNAVPLDDMNADGVREVSISTTDIYFPNIQCYDIASGEKLWDFSPKTEVYDPYILWTMKQTGVFDVVAIGDINGDGKSDVAASAGYSVYALDGESGKQIWQYKDTDNVWDIDVAGGNIIAGDQNGYIFLLESDSGRVLWSRRIAPDYTVTNPSTNSEVGDVKRSVWGIVPLEVDGKARAAVSAEDGKMYLIDVSDGEIVWETEVIDYVDTLLYQYYGDTPIPTSSVGYNFFNLRVTILHDATGDGDSDILASSFTGVRRGKEYKGVQGLYMLDSDTGNVEWENENTVLSYTQRPAAVDLGEEYIAIPQGKVSGKEKIRLMDPRDGTTYDTMDINSSSQQGRGGTHLIKSWEEDSFLFVSSSDDVVLAEYPDNVLWRYPRTSDVVIKRADFTGDQETDMLVKSRDGADAENPFDEGKSRIMFVIDGATDDIAWTYELSSDEFMDTGGISEVRVSPDINGDGKADIIGYRQHYSDWDSGDKYGEHARVMIFSGKTGRLLMNEAPVEADYYGMYDRLFTDSILFNETAREYMLDQWGLSEKQFEEIPYSQKREFYSSVEERKADILERKDDVRIRKVITSIDVISDRSGDGVPDLIIGCWSDVIIKDSVTGEILWNRTTRDHYYENPFTGQRPAGVTSGWTDNDRGRYIVIGDVNGDDVEELVAATDQELIFLHSNVTGESLDYVAERTTDLKDGFNREGVISLGDLNGNGAEDIMFEKYVPDAPPVFMIVEGRNGRTIMETERSGTGFDYGEADFNGNGFDDFIVFSMWTEGGGPRLQVKDGRTGETIMNYNGIEESWMLRDIFGYETVLPATPAGDINGDGTPDLAIVMSQAWQPGAEVLLYDVKNNEEITSIVVEDVDRTRGGDSSWMPGIMAERLSDVNGDGKSEIGIITAVGEEHSKQIKMFIVDPVNKEIISDFGTVGKEIIDMGEDKVGIVGTSGNIFFLDITKELSITSPAPGSVVGSPLAVEWSGSSESVATVLVDSQRTVMTEDSTAEFEIMSGSHKITVYSFDKYGKGVYDSVDVTVQKESGTAFAATVAVIILLGLLFSPKILTFVMGARK